MPTLAVLTTVPDTATAERLSRAAVEQHLAACVHSEAIHSVYEWKGEVQSEPEVRLTFKTTDSAYAALEALILELHPYELPAIFALPVVAGSEPYLAWVEAAVSQPKA